MGDTKKKMTIGVIADTSELMSGIEKSLEKIAKTKVFEKEVEAAVDGPLKKLSGEFDALKLRYTNLEKEIEQNKLGGDSAEELIKKLSSLDKELKTLQSQVGTLEATFSTLSKEDFKTTTQGMMNLGKEIETVSNSFNKLKEGMGDIGKLVLADPKASSRAIEDLKKQKLVIDSILSDQVSITNLDSLFDELEKLEGQLDSTNDFQLRILTKEEITTITSNITLLRKQLYEALDSYKNKAGKDFTVSEDYENDFQKLSTTAQDAAIEVLKVTQQLSDLSRILTVTNFDEKTSDKYANFFEEVENIASNGQKVLKERLRIQREEIDSQLNDIGSSLSADSAILNFNKGKIQIPATITYDSNKLISDALNLVKKIQDEIDKVPVNIPVKLDDSKLNAPAIIKKAQEEIDKATPESSKDTTKTLEDVISKLEEIRKIIKSISETDFSKLMGEGFTESLSSLKEAIVQIGVSGNQTGKQWLSVVDAARKLFDLQGKFKTTGINELKKEFFAEYSLYKEMGGQHDIDFLGKSGENVIKNASQLKSLKKDLTDSTINESLNKTSNELNTIDSTAGDISSKLSKVIDSYNALGACLSGLIPSLEKLFKPEQVDVFVQQANDVNTVLTSLKNTIEKINKDLLNTGKVATESAEKTKDIASTKDSTVKKKTTRTKKKETEESVIPTKTTESVDNVNTSLGITEEQLNKILVAIGNLQNIKVESISKETIEEINKSLDVLKSNLIEIDTFLSDGKGKKKTSTVKDIATDLSAIKESISSLDKLKTLGDDLTKAFQSEGLKNFVKELGDAVTKLGQLSAAIKKVSNSGTKEETSSKPASSKDKAGDVNKINTELSITEEQLQQILKAIGSLKSIKVGGLDKETLSQINDELINLKSNLDEIVTLLSSDSKSGKTSVVKDIATSIETIGSSISGLDSLKTLGESLDQAFKSEGLTTFMNKLDELITKLEAVSVALTKVKVKASKSKDSNSQSTETKKTKKEKTDDGTWKNTWVDDDKYQAYLQSKRLALQELREIIKYDKEIEKLEKEDENYSKNTRYNKLIALREEVESSYRKRLKSIYSSGHTSENELFANQLYAVENKGARQNIDYSSASDIKNQIKEKKEIFDDLKELYKVNQEIDKFKKDNADISNYDNSELYRDLQARKKSLKSGITTSIRDIKTTQTEGYFETFLKEFKELQSELQAKAKSASIKYTEKLDSEKNNAEQVEAQKREETQLVDLYKQLLDATKKRVSLQNELTNATNKVDAENAKNGTNVHYSNDPAVQEITNQLIAAKQLENQLQKDYFDSYDSASDKSKEAVDRFWNTLSKANSDGANKVARTIAKGQSDIDKELRAQQLQKDSYSSSIQESFGSIDTSKFSTVGLEKFNALQKEFSSFDATTTVEQYKKLADAVAKFNNEQNKYKIDNSNTPFSRQGIQGVEEFKKSVEDGLKTYKNFKGNFSNNGKQWTGEIETANGEVRKLSVSFDELNQTSKVTFDEMQKGSLGSFKDSLTATGKEITSIIGRYASLAAVVGYFTRSIREGWQSLQSYDKALTNIKYTMQLSEAQFDALGKSTVEMAKSYKLSIENAMAISQIYANMQTTSEEIIAIAEPTAVLANLSSATTETASNQIQSVMQQFSLAEDQAMHIVDVYDKVSASIKMDYAKGIQTIAGGVQAAGQVAYDAGMSFEQLAAVIAKTAERTREEGSSIGQALKTITVRLSKASKLSGADEVDNTTLSDASKALSSIGIKVYEANGEFRQLDVILSELAAKWDSLSDAQQAQISYTVAATRQTNKFRAILDSWTESMALAKQATEEEGNALANQQKYAESIAGSIQGIKTEMDAFWLSFLDSDAIKSVLTSVLDLVKGFNSLSEVITPLGALMATTFGTTAITGLSKSLLPLLKKFVLSGTGGLYAMLATAVVGAASAFIIKAKQLTKEATTSATESGTKDIINAADSLDEYSEKIAELRNKMEDSTTTEEEYYEAKSQLVSLQQTLVDTYGTEAENLDLINGKYEEQIELINSLQDKKIASWGDEIAGKNIFGDPIYNKDVGQKAWEKMRGAESQVTYYYSPSEDLKKQLNALNSKYGNISQNNAVTTFDFTGEDLEDVVTSLENYKKELIEIRDSYDESSKDWTNAQYAISQIDKIIENNNKVIEENSELAKSYTLWKMNDINLSQTRANSSPYGTALDLYQAYGRAAQEYSSAVASGDKERIASARETFTKINGYVDEFVDIADNRVAKLFDEITDMAQTSIASDKTNVFLETNKPYLKNTADTLTEHGLRGEDIRLGTYDHDSQEGRTIDNLIKKFENLGYSSEEAANALATELETLVPAFKVFTATLEAATERVSMSAAVSRVDTATEKSNTVTKAYDAMIKRGDGSLNNDELKSIYDAFGGADDLGDGIDIWLSKLVEAKGNAEKTKEVLSDMMTVWANSKNYLDGATGSARTYIEEGLENAGFTIDELTDKQKAYLDKQAEANKEALETLSITDEQVAKLQEEAEQVGISEEAWKNYYISKLELDGTLDFNDEITKLSALNTVLKLGRNAWIDYYAAKNGKLSSEDDLAEQVGRGMNGGGSAKVNEMSDEEREKYYQDYSKALNAAGGDYAKAAQTKLKENMEAEWNRTIEYYNLRTNGVTSYNPDENNNVKNTGSGSGSSELSEKEYEWVKTKIEAADRARKKYSTIMDSQYTSFEEKQAISGGNYDKTKQFLKKYQNEVTKYQKQFDSMYSTLTSKFGESFAKKISEDVKSDKGVYGNWMEEYLKAHPKTGITDSQYEFLEKYESVYYKLIDAQEKLTDVQQNGYYDSEAGINSMLDAYENYINVLKEAKTLYDQRWETSKQLIRDNAASLGYGGNADTLINKIMNGDLTKENWHDEYTTGKKGELSKAAQEILEDAITDYGLVADSEQEILEAENDYYDALIKAFDTRIKQTEHAITMLSSAAESIQNSMTLRTTTGTGLITQADYKALISNADEQISQLEKQRRILVEESEELEKNSDKWYEVQESIASCDGQIQSLTISQAEWQEAIKDIPINLLKQYLTVLGQIQQQLTSFVSLQQALGKNVTSDYYVQSIELANIQLGKLMEEQSLYQKKLEGTSAYTFGTDKYEEAKTAIAEIDQEINTTIQSMAEWNQTIANMPVQKLENYLTVLEKCQSTLQSYVSMMQARGKVVGETQYQSMIDTGMAQLKTLTEQKAYLTKLLAESGYEEGSEKYLEIQSQISSIDSSIASVVTNINEWNEAIAQLPIQKLEKYAQELENVQSLTQEHISQTQSKGKIVDPNDYKLLLQSANAQITVLNKQKEIYKAQQKNYEVGSDKYNELQTKIDGVDSSIQSVVSSTIEWSNALLNIPIERIQKSNEELQFAIDAYDKLIGEYDQVLSAVSAGISNQIELITEEQEACEKMYNSQIEAIQDVIDKLSQENEARQKLLAVEDAQYDLEKAQNNKSVAIIDESGHKQYVADQEAIRDAQQELENAQYEYRVYELEEQIRLLEEQKEDAIKGYQEQIDKLNDQAKAWEKITKNITEAKDAEAAALYLGEDWLEKVLSGNDKGLLEYIRNLYKDADKTKTEYETVKKTNEDVSNIISEYVKKFEAGEITLEQATTGIAEAAKLIGKNLDATDYVAMTEKLINTTKGPAPVDQAKSETDKAIKELVDLIIYRDQNDKQIETSTPSWQKTADSLAQGAENVAKVLASQDWNAYVTKIAEASKKNNEGIDKFVGSWDTISQEVSKQVTNITNYLNSSEWQQYVQEITAVFKQNNAIMGQYFVGWSNLKVAIQNQIEKLNSGYQHAKNTAVDSSSSGGSSTRPSTTGSSNEEYSQSPTIYGSGEEGWTIDIPGGSSVSFKDFNELVNSEEYKKNFLYHDGLDKGYVGTVNEDQKLKLLQEMSDRIYADNEVPAVLQTDELVLTEDQAEKLVKNIHGLRNAYDTDRNNLLSAMSVRPLSQEEKPSILQSEQFMELQNQAYKMFSEVKKIGTYAANKAKENVNITLNMSNLTFNEISNGQDFANYISKNLSSAIAQNLST